jgi:hypothetical protein
MYPQPVNKKSLCQAYVCTGKAEGWDTGLGAGVVSFYFRDKVFS